MCDNQNNMLGNQVDDNTLLKLWSGLETKLEVKRASVRPTYQAWVPRTSDKILVQIYKNKKTYAEKFRFLYELYLGADQNEVLMVKRYPLLLSTIARVTLVSPRVVAKISDSKVHVSVHQTQYGPVRIRKELNLEAHGAVDVFNYCYNKVHEWAVAAGMLVTPEVVVEKFDMVSKFMKAITYLADFVQMPAKLFDLVKSLVCDFVTALFTMVTTAVSLSCGVLQAMVVRVRDLIVNAFPKVKNFGVKFMTDMEEQIMDLYHYFFPGTVVAHMFPDVTNLVAMAASFVADKVPENRRHQAGFLRQCSDFGNNLRGIDSGIQVIHKFVFFLRDACYYLYTNRTYTDAKLLEADQTLSAINDMAEELVSTYKVCDVSCVRKAYDLVDQLQVKIADAASKRDWIASRERAAFLVVIRTRISLYVQAYVGSPFATNHSRVRPVMYCLYGGSGLGKTLAVNIINNTLIGRCFGGKKVGDNDNLFIYTRNSGDPFFDNYRHQPIVVFDDYRQSASVPGSEDNEDLDLIKMINNAVFPLRIAECARKGTVFFDSKLIALCANKKDYDHNGITCPAALARRFDFKGEVVFRGPGKPGELVVDYWINYNVLGNRTLMHTDRVKYPVPKALMTKKYPNLCHISELIDFLQRTLEYVENHDKGMNEALDKLACKAHMLQDSSDTILERGVQDKEEENSVDSCSEDAEDVVMRQEAKRSVLEREDVLSSSSDEGLSFEPDDDDLHTQPLDIRVITPEQIDIVCSEDMCIVNSPSLMVMPVDAKLPDNFELCESGDKRAVLFWLFRATEEDEWFYSTTVLPTQTYPKHGFWARSKSVYKGMTLLEKYNESYTSKVLNCWMEFLRTPEGTFLGTLLGLTTCMVVVAGVARVYTEYKHAEKIEPIEDMREPVTAMVGHSTEKWYKYIDSIQGNAYRINRLNDKQYDLAMARYEYLAKMEYYQGIGHLATGVQNVLAKIQANQVKIFVDDKFCMSGVFIRGQHLLTAEHLLHRLFTGHKVKIQYTTQGSFECSVDEIVAIPVVGFTYKTCEKPSTDMVVLKMPRTFPNMCCILKHIPEMDNECQYLIDCKSHLVLDGRENQDCQSTARLTLASIPYDVVVRGEMKKMQITAGYLVRTDARHGDCGSALVTIQNSCNKFTGIYVCGDVDRRMGYCSALTRSMFDGMFNEACCARELVEEFDFVNMSEPTTNPKISSELKVIGLDKAVIGKTKNALVETPFYDFYKKCSRAPAVVTPVKRGEIMVNPYTVAVKKNIRPTKSVLDEKILQICVEDYFKTFTWNSRSEVFKGFLSVDEAICGSDNHPYLTGLDLKTGSGYGYSGTSKKDHISIKQGKVTLSAELRSKMQQREDMWNNGSMKAVLWLDKLKSELRSHEKVESATTRLYSSGPLDFTIECKRYFAGLIEYVIENRILNEIALGINPVSDEWGMLAKYVTGGENPLYKLFDGDFKFYDASLMLLVLHAVWRLIEKFYEGSDPEVQKKREALFMEMINAIHVCDGYVYFALQGNPSGCVLTTIINCIYNSITMRYVYCIIIGSIQNFVRDVRLNNFGDDNLVGSANSRFNQASVSKVYWEHLGMQYTAADKASSVSTDFKVISEVSFLKRKFRLVNGWYYAPLEITSIYEAIYYTSSKHNMCLVYMGIMQGMANELVHHGEEVFNSVMRPLLKRAEEVEEQEQLCFPKDIMVNLNYKYWFNRYTLLRSTPTAQYEEVIDETLWKVLNYCAFDDLRLVGCQEIIASDLNDSPNGIKGIGLCRVRLPVSTEAIDRLRGDKRRSFQVERVHVKNSQDHKLFDNKRKERRQSYVRAQANKHAVRVKTQVTSLGKDEEKPHFVGHMMMDDVDVNMDTNSVVSNQQLATFVDTHVITRASAVPVNRVNSLLEVKHNSVEDIMSRTYYYGVGSIAGFNRFDIIDTIAFPGFFEGRSDWLAAAQYFEYFRFDLNVKLTVNASPFSSGRLYLGWLPLWPSVDKQDYQASSAWITGFPGVTVDVGSSQTVTLKIPWVMTQEYFSLSRRGIPLGQIRLSVLSPYRVATIQPEATVAMYFYMSNVERIIPTIADQIALVAHGIEGETVAKTGVVSTVLSKVSGFASFASNWIPMFGGELKALSTIAQAGSTIAGVLGFAKPTTLSAITSVVQRPGFGMIHGNGTDTCECVGIQQDNRLDVSPMSTGFVIDEMSLAYIAQQWNMVGHFPWSSVDTGIIRVIDATPFLCATSLVPVPGEFNATQIALAASMFEYWRGSVRLRLEFVGNKMYSGRLGIAFVPRLDQPGLTARDFANVEHTIWDITESASMDLFIGFNSADRYKQVYLEESGSNAPNIDFILGSVYVYVLTKLTHISGVVDDPDILLSVRAHEDLELSVTGFSNVSVMPPPPVLVAHGMEDKLETNLTSLSPSDEHADSMSAGACIGEKIVNLRTLTRRYYPLELQGIPTGSVQIDPAYFGLDNPIGVIGYMYTFWRGARRYKLFSNLGVMTYGEALLFQMQAGSVDDPTYIPTIAYPRSRARTIQRSTQTGCIEVEVPFYSINRLAAVAGAFGTANPRPRVVLKTTQVDTSLLGSVGDDFSFYGLVGAPRIAYS